MSRSVHLARLLTGYAPCQACPHRAATEGLTGVQRRVLAGQDRRHARPAVWQAEAFTGNLADEFTPQAVGRVSQALGLLLWGETGRRAPVVVLADDGRPRLAAHRQAALAGLTWSGCEVIEAGMATAPITAEAIARHKADGGLLLANRDALPWRASASFYGQYGRPMSSPGHLDELASIASSGMARPARRAPMPQADQAMPPYRRRWRDAYHGLRPLRFTCATSCEPLLRLLADLLAETACAILPDDQRPQAHFGIAIDGLGENISATDEHGIAVPSARLTALVAHAGHLSSASVVAPEPLAVATTRQRAFEQLLMRPTAAGAHLASDGCDRIWVRSATWAPDALAVLVGLLSALSTSDAPLSARVAKV